MIIKPYNDLRQELLANTATGRSLELQENNWNLISEALNYNLPKKADIGFHTHLPYRARRKHDLFWRPA